MTATAPQRTRGPSTDGPTVGLGGRDPINSPALGIDAGTIVSQPLLALAHLQMHVRDVQTRYLPRLREHRGRPLGLVRVHVHLQRRRVADDQHRVPELLQRRDEAPRAQPGAGDGEVRAEAVRARMMLGMADARGRVVIELRRVVAAQRRNDAREDDRQPVTARVDHAGIAQRRQQLGATLDRLLPRRHRALQRSGDRRVLQPRLRVGVQARTLRTVREIGHDLMGHLARHGQDRALRRLAHRGVSTVGRVGQRRTDQRGVDQLSGTADQLLGGAANQLGEDHTRVAARTQQRRAGHRLHDLLTSDLVDRARLVTPLQAVELGQHRAQRERHVVARVAVGNREHVEVVDLLAARFQVRQRPRHGGAEADQVRIGHVHTSITFRGRSARTVLSRGSLLGRWASQARITHPPRVA